MSSATDSLDFEWAGIAFTMAPRPTLGGDRPVVLSWRTPTGEAGSQHFPGVAEAMRHSSMLTQGAQGH